MRDRTMTRLGGLVVMLTGVLFVIGGVFVAFHPLEGNPDAVAGGFYYSGMVLSVLALPALVAAHREGMRWGGLVGFAAAQVGVVMYATGTFLVLPLVADVAGAHDVFLFAAAEVPVFPIGAVLFFLGSATLGVAIRRRGVLPRIGGSLYALGALLWLVAFFAPSSFNSKALLVANLVGAAGALVLGRAMLAGRKAA